MIFLSRATLKMFLLETKDLNIWIIFVTLLFIFCPTDLLRKIVMLQSCFHILWIFNITEGEIYTNDKGILIWYLWKFLASFRCSAKHLPHQQKFYEIYGPYFNTQHTLSNWIEELNIKVNMWTEKKHDIPQINGPTKKSGNASPKQLCYHILETD